jgi:hypothetical protein
MLTAYVCDGNELLISKVHGKIGRTYGNSSRSSGVGVAKSITETLHLVGFELVVSSYSIGTAYVVIIGNNDVVGRLGGSLQTRMSLD